MNMKKQLTLFILLIITYPSYSQKRLNVNECISLALQHNQKIEIARRQVKAADALRKSAFTQYLPNFSINGGYSYFNKDFRLLKEDMLLPVIPYSAIDPATGQVSSALLSSPAVAASTFVVNPATGSVVKDAAGNPVFQKYTWLPASKATFGIDNFYMINGGFTQPVYLGGKIRETNRIARYTRESAEQNLSLSEDEIKYSTEEAYWRVVSVTEKARLAKKYKEMLVRLVSDLENIRAEGIITDNDLLKAKLKLSEADLSLLKAVNGAEMSKMVLCQMTGLSYSEELILSDSLNTYENETEEIVFDEDAINERPEIKILGSGVEIARSGVKIMQSRFLPNIGLTAGYTFMNPNPYNGLAEEFGSDYNIGVAVNIPVFHFGDRKHTLNAAKYEQESAELKLQETKELLILQLHQAAYRHNESVTKAKLAELSLEQASRNLEYTRDNFNEGRLKTTDLLEAQLLWQKAFSELIDARTEQQLSASNLKKVTAKY